MEWGVNSKREKLKDSHLTWIPTKKTSSSLVPITSAALWVGVWVGCVWSTIYKASFYILLSEAPWYIHCFHLKYSTVLPLPGQNTRDEAFCFLLNSWHELKVFLNNLRKDNGNYSKQKIIIWLETIIFLYQYIRQDRSGNHYKDIKIQIPPSGQGRWTPLLGSWPQCRCSPTCWEKLNIADEEQCMEAITNIKRITGTMWSAERCLLITRTMWFWILAMLT